MKLAYLLALLNVDTMGGSPSTQADLSNILRKISTAQENPAKNHEPTGMTAAVAVPKHRLVDDAVQQPGGTGTTAIKAPTLSDEPENPGTAKEPVVPSYKTPVEPVGKRNISAPKLIDGPSQPSRVLPSDKPAPGHAKPDIPISHDEPDAKPVVSDKQIPATKPEIPVSGKQPAAKPAAPSSHDEPVSKPLVTRLTRC